MGGQKRFPRIKVDGPLTCGSNLKRLCAQYCENAAGYQLGLPAKSYNPPEYFRPTRGEDFNQCNDHRVFKAFCNLRRFFLASRCSNRSWLKILAS